MTLNFTDQIIKGILNYPILYIPHFHRKYILEEVRNACRELFGSDGLRMIDCSEKDIIPDDYVKICVVKLAVYLRNVLQYGGDYELAPPVCTICEVDEALLNDSRFIALLHQFAQNYENTFKGLKCAPKHTIILCVPSGNLPPVTIAGVCSVLSITPPSASDIHNELTRYGMKGITPETETDYVRALQGLQLFDVRQIICSTRNTYGKTLYSVSVKWAYEEKQDLIRKTGILEVVEPDVSLNDVGGLKILKADIKNTARLYQNLNTLQKVNVPIPKGYLLLGMPGCGKSMIAKATAAEFGCPLLKLDMGKLLGKYVGDSEHNLQLALDVVDSAHPCVLWIDEIEKAFAGTNNSSGEGDAVMMRLMGKFLSWMQERKTAVFIMATANDVLKPELMRKGRFDEVYFVDFPSSDEAKQIISKTIGKYDKENREFSNNLKGLESWWLENADGMTSITLVEKGGKNKKDVYRGLSGAEIKSLLDSFIADTISRAIKQAEDAKTAFDIGAMQFDERALKKALSKATESAMIRQITPVDSIDEPKSFIDKIYMFEKKYNFKHASK